MIKILLLTVGLSGLTITIVFLTVNLLCLISKMPTFKFYTDKDNPYLYVKLPKRATKGSAGYDIFLPRTLTFPAKSVIIVDTGVKTKIPKGFVMNIYPRSSIGIKKQLMLANTVGIIDSDFHDTIKLAVYNYGDETVTLNANERIAQAVTIPYITDGSKVHATRNGGIGSTGR